MAKLKVQSNVCRKRHAQSIYLLKILTFLCVRAVISGILTYEKILSVIDTQGAGAGGGGSYSLIWAIQVCAGPKRYGFLAVLL